MRDHAIDGAAISWTGDTGASAVMHGMTATKCARKLNHLSANCARLSKSVFLRSEVVHQMS